MRNVKEEYEYIVENESEGIKRHLSLLLESKWKKESSDGKVVLDDEKKMYIERALQMNLNEMAITRVLNNIAAWINDHDDAALNAK